MIVIYLKLLYTFFKIGIVGFGGGYAMLSMVITESSKFGITAEQFADLTVLDMVVPGPIAINAATYVGYLRGGYLGATFATIGVSLPSFLIVTLVMIFIKRFSENKVMNGVLYGIKPAAVGLIAAAAMTIASGVLLLPDTSLSNIFTNPLGTISVVATIIFILAFLINIKFKVNPILLTLIAGVVGAFLL
jgi:chromate transporter